MFRTQLAILLAAGLVGCSTAVPRRPSAWTAPEILVQPSSFAGVHGLAIDRQGRLLASSVIGNKLWEVDPRTGAARVLVDGPEGQSDDVAVGPEGELAWTSPFMGKVHYRESRDAPTQVLAQNLPGINALAFDPRNGKLYATQTGNTGHADTLLELDRKGQRPPRLIARDHGSLNGFGVGPDGMVYGPLMFKGQLVRIDPADGHTSVIAGGFKVPTAVDLDGKGNAWVADSATGEIVRVELATGHKTLVKQLKPTIDNVAVSSDGTVYVSNMADNSIEAFDPVTGETRVLTSGRISVPGGMKIDGDSLYLTDVFSFREIDVRTGEVSDIFRRQRDPELLLPFSTGLSRTHFALTSWLSGTVVIVDRATRKSVGVLRDLKTPIDAIPLADGSVVYAENVPGTITRRSGPGFGTSQILASGLDGPAQMLLGRDEDAIYVTEAAAGRLIRIPLEGGTVAVLAAGLKAPEGLAITPWGSFIVAEAGARRLVEIDPSTGSRRAVAEDLPIGLAPYPGAPLPYVPTGVAVGDDGSVYVSADLNNAVYRIKPVR